MKTFLNSVNRENLTSSEVQILEYLQNNVDSINYMSLNDLCKELYVSNATIVRFCQKIGLNGFNELKFSLKTNLNQTSALSDPLHSIFQQTAALKDFIQNIDNNTVEEIVQLMQSKESIYIYGRGISSLPAKYLYSMLNSMDIPCIFVDWIDSFKALSKSITNNSLLFIFTNIGEKNIYKEIIQQYHTHNTKIIWISSTDIDESLINPSDIYVHTNEEKTETTFQNKLNTFSFIQILVDYVRVKA